MNYLVIGQSVEDHIFTKGKEIVRPGGVFYSMLALTNLVDAADNLHLVTSMQNEKLDLFYPVYSGLNKDYFEFKEMIPRINLTIHEDKERDEEYQNISLGINTDKIKFDNYDSILINMITGFDINLEQLKNIRKNFGKNIFMDVHSLSRGLEPDKTRRFKRIKNSSEWLSNVDIVQSNRNELKTLSDKTKEEDIVEELFNNKIKILLITKEADGASLYYKEGNNIVTKNMDAVKVEVKNKVGCGDIFGATFFYFYSKLKDIDTAFKLAVKAGGMTASYGNIEDFRNLRNDIV